MYLARRLFQISLFSYFPIISSDCPTIVPFFFPFLVFFSGGFIATGPSTDGWSCIWLAQVVPPATGIAVVDSRGTARMIHRTDLSGGTTCFSVRVNYLSSVWYEKKKDCYSILSTHPLPGRSLASHCMMPETIIINVSMYSIIYCMHGKNSFFFNKLIGMG